MTRGNGPVLLDPLPENSPWQPGQAVQGNVPADQHDQQDNRRDRVRRRASGGAGGAGAGASALAVALAGAGGFRGGAALKGEARTARGVMHEAGCGRSRRSEFRLLVHGLEQKDRMCRAGDRARGRCYRLPSFIIAKARRKSRLFARQISGEPYGAAGAWSANSDFHRTSIRRR